MMMERSTIATKKKASSHRRPKTPYGAQSRFCVFYGTEPMLMRLHIESLRQAIAAQHGEVDTTVFDGSQTALADVLDELRGFSLLGGYKLVIVDQADTFTTAHRQPLERYAQAPVDHATLVLRCQRWHRGRLDKLIEKMGCLVKCEPYRPAQAQTWIVERASRQYARTLTPEAAATLVGRIGCDLMQLDNELAKLTLAVEPDQPIDTTAVKEQVVAQGGDEKAWAIQEAILSSLLSTPSKKSSTTATAGHLQDTPVTKRIHQLIDQSGQPPVLVTYFVADLMRKLVLAAMMSQQGRDVETIVQRFKLWGPQRNLFLRVLQRYNDSSLSDMFDQIIQLDAGAKTGLGSSIRNLECFCATLDSSRR